MCQNGNRIIEILIMMGVVNFALIGCKPTNRADSQAGVEQSQGPSAQHSASAPSSILIRPDVTAEQWTRAVGQVFDKVNIKRLRDKKNPAYVEDQGKADENGVTEFFACFDKAPPKCDLSASGRRDGFRKLQFFTDPVMEYRDITAKYSRGVGKPFVRAYVSLRDCYRPTIILQPTFRATNWLFLDQFGLMVDGTLVIERKFDAAQVDRENSHNEVSEAVHLVLDKQEVETLRKVVQAKSVLIRLTGKKGYVGIDIDGTKDFVDGIGRLLRIHDALGQAVDSLGQVKDATCPL